MANQIKFIQLTQSKYNDILSSSATVSSSIYFTSDTGRIYKGSQLFTKDFLIVQTAPTVASEMEADRLYVVATTGDMYIRQNNSVVQVGGQSAQMSQVKANVSSNYSEISALSDSFNSHVAEFSSASSSLQNSINTLTSDKLDKTDFNSYSSTTAETLSTLTGNISSNTADIGTLRSSLNSLTDSSVVTLDSNATVTDGYLKTYQIKQGGISIGKIDIPKDLVVTSGSVVTAGDGQNGTQAISGATAGDKYIKLVIANQTAPIYIAVKDLVDVYSAEQNATEVQLTIGNNNEISAEIVTGSIAKTKLAQAVQTSLDKADTAYQSSDFSAFSSSLDTDMNGVKNRIDALESFQSNSNSTIDGRIDAKIAELDSSKTAASGNFINSITIEDGKITSIGESSYTLSTGSAQGTISWNGTDVAVNGLGSAAYTNSTAYDASGSAENVQNTLTGESTDSTSTLTLNGLSNRITSLNTDLGTAINTASSTALAAANSYTDQALQWEILS